MSCGDVVPRSGESRKNVALKRRIADPADRTIECTHTTVVLPLSGARMYGPPTGFQRWFDFDFDRQAASAL